MKDEEGWANSLASLPNDVILWTDTHTASGILTVALVRSVLGVWNWTILPAQKICSYLNDQSYKWPGCSLVQCLPRQQKWIDNLWLTQWTLLQPNYIYVDIRHHLQIIMTKIMLLAPRVTRLITSPNIMISRGFIKHRRSKNSPSTTHNSPAKFQWSMAIFYSDEADVDMSCKKILLLLMLCKYKNLK